MLDAVDMHALLGGQIMASPEVVLLEAIVPLMSSRLPYNLWEALCPVSAYTTYSSYLLW